MCVHPKLDLSRPVGDFVIVEPDEILGVIEAGSNKDYAMVRINEKGILPFLWEQLRGVKHFGSSLRLEKIQ